MIHIGSAEFYQEVRKRLDRCDVVLFEGVGSFAVKVLTTSYTFAARRKRLGLVTQSEALPLREMRGVLVHGDVPGSGFDAAWRAVPWHWRVAVMVCAPLYGAWLYLTASRESIGRRLRTEDLEAREDVLRFEAVPQLEDAIATKRDASLAIAITGLLERPGDHTRAGVIYGAAHMRVVTRLLIEKHGYRVVDAEWLDVFRYAA
jgi:hypothetical protein